MSWLGRKKSPKLTTGAVPTGTGTAAGTAAGGGVDVVSSGSVERPADGRTGSAVVGSWLEGAGQGLHNPLAWDSIPSSLKQQFPHWKEESSPGSKGNSSEAAGQDYSCYKTRSNTMQQPDYTFPYVVMDNDTLSSIAVKFETTPAELARLNKKPLGVNSTIFTGEVLYVPDQEEMARSAPKPAPGQVSKVLATEQLQSSMDSQGTLRSSSINHATEGVADPTLPGAAPNSEGKGDHRKEGEEGREEHVMESQQSTASPTQEFFEEIADDHIVLVSRYISDDQGCAHGHLMINRTAVMFTPFPTDSLVIEHGSANFEVMIPLQDITFAAFTRDVNPPSSKKKTVTEIPLAVNEEALNGVGEERKDGVDKMEGEENVSKKEIEDGMSKEEGVASKEGEEGVAKGEGVAEEEEESVAREEEEEGVRDGGVAGEESNHDVSKEDVAKDKSKDVTETEGGGVAMEGTVAREEGVVSGAESKDQESEHRVTDSEQRQGGCDDSGTANKEIPAGENSDTREVSAGEDCSTAKKETPVAEAHKGHPNQPSCSSTDELLAIMGVDTASQRPRHTCDSQNISESPEDVSLLLSEQPCFLHLRVSHKCSAAHTYTPVNLPVGIDIPQNAYHTPRGLLQQVRLNFCFAVAERRVGDLVSFIASHHPGGQCEVRSPVTSSWSDGSFEFIAREDAAHEDLNFSDNHFKGAESAESWEICSLKDFSKYRRIIDKMEVEHELPLPLLSEESVLMKESHLKALSPNLISAAVGHDWVLIYSTFKHGISLRTLYRNMQLCDLEESAVILLVRDDQNKLFGAAVTARLRISDKFYGTGESFLFSFESSDLEIYPWTGANNYIVKGSSDSIGIGCDDGHYGLWLDEYLLNGSSQECSTFANACLSSATDFTCTGLEAWGFR